MKTMYLFCCAFIIHAFTVAQEIYSKAYGNPNNEPVIFFHGGPGYNAASFEITTAQTLADSGFYVIVYDRRGEGRSIDTNAAYTFEQSFDDLDELYDMHQLKKAVLIGHSFGGIIATLYAEKYPEKVKSIMLVSAPVVMQETFSTIVKTSKEIYARKNDTVNLSYIALLEEMDTTSLNYSSYCFSHAMQNGFYYPRKPSEDAMTLYESFKTDAVLLKHSSQMTYEAPLGFWKNEQYTTLDLRSNLKQVVDSKILVIGLYGKEDGLFSELQILELQEIVGKDQLSYLNNCSHNVFVDQQELFIATCKRFFL